MKAKESFALMWYACPCGHRERLWNSRDGVTPFALLCPSCGLPRLVHVWWSQDAATPNHVPHHGQRVFLGLTLERARSIVSARADAVAEHARAVGAVPPIVTAKDLERLAVSMFRGGVEPDIAVTGYTEELAGAGERGTTQ